MAILKRTIQQTKRIYFDNYQEAQDFKYEQQPFSKIVKLDENSYYIEYEVWVVDES